MEWGGGGVRWGRVGWGSAVWLALAWLSLASVGLSWLGVFSESLYLRFRLLFCFPFCVGFVSFLLSFPLCLLCFLCFFVCLIPSSFFWSCSRCFFVCQVKWRGLEYEECTWEMEADLEDYMHLVQAFLDREKFGETMDDPKHVSPSFFVMVSVSFSAGTGVICAAKWYRRGS